MADEAYEASHPLSPPREPPPSSGMVAHIWGGHLGQLDVDPRDAEPAEVALDAAVEVREQPGPAVKVN